jgi:hypothetical protein
MMGNRPQKAFGCNISSFVVEQRLLTCRTRANSAVLVAIREALPLAIVAGELQSLPKEARKILRGIDKSEPAIADAFDRGARLYQVASVCGHLFPSVGLAYRVAAVEAISSADQYCKGFSEFMRKHLASRPGLDSILSYLYGYARSGHFHGGAFPMGEFERHQYFDPLMDTESVERDSIHRACYEITREAIVNWMQTMVPEEPEDSAGVVSDSRPPADLSSD